MGPLDVRRKNISSLSVVFRCARGSRMGFLDRKIAQSVMLGLSNDLGLELDMKGRNDLRDWDRIRDFAHRFAESLNK